MGKFISVISGSRIDAESGCATSGDAPVMELCSMTLLGGDIK
jgi:hypothetical protein